MIFRYTLANSFEEEDFPSTSEEGSVSTSSLEDMFGSKEGTSSREEGNVLLEPEEVPVGYCVTPEPLGMVSHFVNHHEEAFVQVAEERDPHGEGPDWMVIFPEKHEHICLIYETYRFPIYEFLFKDLGMRIPFSDL